MRRGVCVCVCVLMGSPTVVIQCKCLRRLGRWEIGGKHEELIVRDEEHSATVGQALHNGNKAMLLATAESGSGHLNW